MNRSCSVAIIILAAGESKRLGQPKQLIPYRGTTLLGNIIETALSSQANLTIVVTGAHSDVVRASIAKYDITVIENQQWQDGMASSIVFGLESVALADACPNAVLLLTSDQPGVTTQLLDEIISLYNDTAGRIVASAYENTMGVPALFDQAYFSELKQLEGDRGARSIINKNRDQVVAVDFPGGALDIDTAEDLEKL